MTTPIIQSIRNRLRSQRHNQSRMIRYPPETRKAPESSEMNVYLVVKRKPLSQVPWLYRLLARWVYFRIGWASDYSVEYQGVYTEESEARWAASGEGMSYTEIPWNASLPEDTCQCGTHDFPWSEASAEYRNRKLPFVSVPRYEVERLQQTLARTKPA
jgi:hypothetical protein